MKLADQDAGESKKSVRLHKEAGCRRTNVDSDRIDRPNRQTKFDQYRFTTSPIAVQFRANLIELARSQVPVTLLSFKLDVNFRAVASR